MPGDITQNSRSTRYASRQWPHNDRIFFSEGADRYGQHDKDCLDNNHAGGIAAAATRRTSGIGQTAGKNEGTSGLLGRTRRHRRI